MKFSVFGVDGISRGDFTAIAAPGWAVGGSRAVNAGGSISVEIPDFVAEQPWMQLGNLVLTRPHPDLELWAGMIDTPWTATLPVKVTFYNIEYLLKIRTPDNESLEKGSVDKIMRRMVELANAQQEIFLRIGTVGEIDKTAREETLKQVDLWGQFQALGQRTNTQFATRPVIENGRLMIYLDLASSPGEDTNYLLFDGEQGNMTITSAVVDGEIYNRVIGVGSQSTPTSRLQTSPQLDASSIEKYRLRSAVTQFKDVTVLSTLEKNTKNFLGDSKQPYLKLTVEILNHENVFKLLRRGNTFVTHASKLYLPGGVRSWKGLTQINALTYLESRGVVAMTLIGAI